jgi:hypothetical protein
MPQLHRTASDADALAAPRPIADLTDEAGFPMSLAAVTRKALEAVAMAAADLIVLPLDDGPSMVRRWQGWRQPWPLQSSRFDSRHDRHEASTWPHWSRTAMPESSVEPETPATTAVAVITGVPAVADASGPSDVSDAAGWQETAFAGGIGEKPPPEMQRVLPEGRNAPDTNGNTRRIQLSFFLSRKPFAIRRIRTMPETDPIDTTGEINSNRELARRLDVSETSVRNWQKDARWTFGSAPWSLDLLPTLEEWRDTMRDGQPLPVAGDGEPAVTARVIDLALKQSRIELVEEQVRKARRDNDAMEGLLIRREAVADALDDLIEKVGTAIDQVPHQVIIRLPWLHGHPQKAEAAASIEKELKKIHQLVITFAGERFPQ